MPLPVSSHLQCYRLISGFITRVEISIGIWSWKLGEKKSLDLENSLSSVILGCHIIYIAEIHISVDLSHSSKTF